MKKEKIFLRNQKILRIVNISRFEVHCIKLGLIKQKFFFLPIDKHTCGGRG